RPACPRVGGVEAVGNLQGEFEHCHRSGPGFPGKCLLNRTRDPDCPYPAPVERSRALGAGRWRHQRYGNEVPEGVGGGRASTAPALRGKKSPENSISSQHERCWSVANRFVLAGCRWKLAGVDPSALDIKSIDSFSIRASGTLRHRRRVSICDPYPELLRSQTDRCRKGDF